MGQRDPGVRRRPIREHTHIHGEGLCCDHGAGWFRLSSGDVVLRRSDAGFGAVNVTQFALPVDGAPPLLWNTLVPVTVPKEATDTAPPTKAPVAWRQTVFKVDDAH